MPKGKAHQVIRWEKMIYSRVKKRTSKNRSSLRQEALPIAKIECIVTYEEITYVRWFVHDSKASRGPREQKQIYS